MAVVELDKAEKEVAVAKLQAYFRDELQTELGSFDAQFLLDFLAEHVAYQFYNKGLADALKAVSHKMEEVSELIYDLEMAPPES
ncbi:MAG: DUF2164 domain-containing protein [Pseudomonadales bacterium]|nr:DUF2164 domain-containing protein [Pseudomonadales bacterium]